MTSNSDKCKDKTDPANSTATQNKADKFTGTRETLGRIINKIGVFAGKIFALGKAVTKDISHELRNINIIRKETVAAAADKKKTELVKTFWAQTSGKQRGILLTIGLAFFTVLYFVLAPSSDMPSAKSSQKDMSLETKINKKIEINENNCLKITGISNETAVGIAQTFKVPLQTIRVIGSKWTASNPYRKHMCIVTVDTGIGPKDCLLDSVFETLGGALITNGKSTFVHEVPGAQGKYCSQSLMP